MGKKNGNGKHDLPRGFTVCVSSKPEGSKQMEAYRDEALGKLFNAGVSTFPLNGDMERFSLLDMHKRIVAPEDPKTPPPDAYVFLPFPKGQLRENTKQVLLREMFKAASLFVGMQTGDPALKQRPDDPRSPSKPMIMVNHDKAWQPLYDLALRLHEQGTITKHPDRYMKLVPNIAEAIVELKEAAKSRKPAGGLAHAAPFKFTENELEKRQRDPNLRRQPDFNVCVFCSASTKDKALISMAHELGQNIAEEGWGLVSGMGATGMMGAVVNGANEMIDFQVNQGMEKRGWVGGSNLMRILKAEGVPDGYDKLWLENDIYTRMDKMIDNSQAFIIMPGGMGTVQEFMALLLLKHTPSDQIKRQGRDRSQMHKKPIIVVNPEYEHGGKKQPFWDGLIDLAQSYGFGNDFKVVGSVEEAMDALSVHAPGRWQQQITRPASSGSVSPDL